MTRDILAEDGRALVLAMDHGRNNGALQGLEDPGKTLQDLLGSGVDAVLCNFGVLKHHRDLLAGRVPVVMRLDGGESVLRADWLAYREWRQLFSVEDAVAAGADAVVTMLFLGADAELDTFEVTARAAGQARRAGVPLMVEALPCPSERVPDPVDPKLMADAARIAFEHGADLIKNYYTGSAETYAQSVAATPLPTLIAGGEKMGGTREVLEAIAAGIQAGGKGAVIGRNIWQHPDPKGMAAALSAIIHSRASADEALGMVRA
jgi:class I fructose-bisphosphate aldolase